MKRKLIATTILASLLSSCSYFLDTSGWHYQRIKLVTDPAGAHCTLRNDYGQWQLITPDYIAVHRSTKPLLVACYKPEFTPTQTSYPGIIPIMAKGDIVRNWHPIKKNIDYTYPSHIYIRLHLKH